MSRNALDRKSSWRCFSSGLQPSLAAALAAMGLLTGAGCVAPKPLPPVPQLPALDIAPVAVAPEVALRAAADRSPPPVAPFPLRRPGDDASDDRGPIYRTVTYVVETPAPNYQAAEEWRDGDEAYARRGSWRYGSSLGYGRDRRPWFPINTAVGAGIGAIIGHQRGHRDRGALIGGTWGLLFDLARWAR